MSITGAKVVIDTNIFITIIGRKSPNRWIFDEIRSGNLQLCVSNEILFEYEEILTRKTNAKIARNVLVFLMLSPFVEKIGIFYNWKLIKSDPDDNKFVDCAVSADACCIVSNDKHFNALQTIDFPPVKVINLKTFEQKYRTFKT